MQKTYSSKEEEDKDALSKSKIQLMTKKGAQFLISLCLQLEHEISTAVSTASTNGKRNLYNPDFFTGITKAQRLGLIAHEVWHIAYLHMFRRGDRDPLIWNYAGDFVINGMLIANDFELPPDGCLDAQFDGWSTDQVYDYLIDNAIEPPPGYIGDIEDPTGTSQQVEDFEQQVTNTVIRAVHHMQAEGHTVPAEIAIAIEKLINPKLNWKEILYQYIDAKVKEDSSWRKPNRRYQPAFYLPTRYTDALENLTVAIDTSGSMTLDMLQEILSEIQYINETIKPTNLTILDCDADIHNIYKVDHNDHILTYKFSGGGGTSFYPVIDYCKEHDTNLLVYFTDLDAQQITEKQDYPIIWVCSTNHAPAPTGITIYANP